MKATLAAGLTGKKTISINEERCISFMGREGMVYATPRLVGDMELTCRDFLLQHLDAGEDSVGVHVSIDHLAATPLGMDVTIEVSVTAVDKRKVTFSFTARDGLEECGKGTHVRFIVDTAKTQERLAAKRAKAGLK
jgi:predicted thioesterase